MNDVDICYLPAVELADAIRSKTISPVEVTSAVVAHIEALEPKLNAFATFTPERALDGAKAAEQAVVDGESLGPLHGVPVTLKDLTTTKDVPTQRAARFLPTISLTPTR